MNEIHGLNEDTHVFSTELKNNEGDSKEGDDKDSEASTQPIERNTGTNDNGNKRKIWLDLSIQFNTVCEVYKATIQLTIDNEKLSTYDLCNNAEEKSVKTHRDNMLNTFSLKIKITNTCN